MTSPTPPLAAQTLAALTLACAASLSLSPSLAQAADTSTPRACPHAPPHTKLSAEAATLLGRWITANGNLEVQIQPCAEGWCGTVTQVLGNRSMSAPDQQMQAADTRPALGMTLLHDLRPPTCGTPQAEAFDPEHLLPQDCRTWTGKIYNRENGKTYRCTLAVDGEGQLIVRPYVGLPVFGRNLAWTRTGSARAAQESSTVTTDSDRP